MYSYSYKLSQYTTATNVSLLQGKRRLSFYKPNTSLSLSYTQTWLPTLKSNSSPIKSRAGLLIV